MKLIAEWLLPIKTVSEANSNEHWTKKRKRYALQKEWIWATFLTYDLRIPERCHVKLTRVAPRKLDSDNLVSSMKYIRDEIANHLNPGHAPGFADSNENITWEYDQMKINPKEYMVKIEIYELNKE